MEGKKDSTQDVEIAVLTKEVEHMSKSVLSLEKMMSERVNSLTETIRSFIEVANKKVDRDIYLEDKRTTSIQISELKSEVKKNTDFRKEYVVADHTRDETEKKIWGFSQGGISSIISILTIITLIAAVIAIFK